MNVLELRKRLENLPDDAPVVIVGEDWSITDVRVDTITRDDIGPDAVAEAAKAITGIIADDWEFARITRNERIVTWKFESAYRFQQFCEFIGSEGDHLLAEAERV